MAEVGKPVFKFAFLDLQIVGSSSLFCNWICTGDAGPRLHSLDATALRAFSVFAKQTFTFSNALYTDVPLPNVSAIVLHLLNSCQCTYWSALTDVPLLQIWLRSKYLVQVSIGFFLAALRPIFIFFVSRPFT